MELALPARDARIVVFAKRAIFGRIAERFCSSEVSIQWHSNFYPVAERVEIQLQNSIQWLLSLFC